MKDPAIMTTDVMPMIPNTINTIAHGSVISKQDSCMGTQLLLPSSGRLPHIFSGHTSQLFDNVEFVSFLPMQGSQAPQHEETTLRLM